MYPGKVGRLYPERNYRLFIDMAKSVSDRFGKKSIKFLIVGDGPLKYELEECSKMLGIKRNSRKLEKIWLGARCFFKESTNS